MSDLFVHVLMILVFVRSVVGWGVVILCGGLLEEGLYKVFIILIKGIWVGFCGV